MCSVSSGDEILSSGMDNNEHPKVDENHRNETDRQKVYIYRYIYIYMCVYI
jgi:hypothetical protein